MKLNDKIKELTENWTEWGNCYSEINKELENPKPNAFKLNELFNKKVHLSTKRATLMKELQTLLDKTGEDIRIKVDRVFNKE